MINQSERINQIREEVLSSIPDSWRSPENQLNWYRSWLESRYETHHLVRVAVCKAKMHKKATPVISDQELIVGRPCYKKLSQAEKQELDEYERLVAPALPNLNGQASHMAIDYQKILGQGLQGLIVDLNTRRMKLNPEEPQSLKKDVFYQACQTALQGVIDYASRYADYASLLAGQSQDPVRKAELHEIAAICKKVPRFPASTFHEAVQSIHFVTFCLEGLYQLGRPDRYLLRYYNTDLQSGRLDKQKAQELIDCLCLMLSTYIPKGLAVGLMVGGSDAKGTDQCNQLTELFLRSIAHTRLSYPGIGLCVTPDTPDELLKLSCSLLASGTSHPALFNDTTIRRGLELYDVPETDSWNYIHSTCVEITPVASSAVWVASPYINLVQLLLDTLKDKSISISRYDDLETYFRQHLSNAVSQAVTEQNRWQCERETQGGDPLVSCFVDDCLEKGKDIDQGGARYNWIMPSFVGLSNLADALTAVRELVFTQGQLKLQDLVKLLENNFDGSESIRQLLLNKPAKYGNDHDAADAVAASAATWIAQEVSRHRTWRDDHFVPSLFCWIMHEQFGQQTGASPDGRPAGFPLADGSGPAQGREKNGPTASLLSSTKWSHEPFIGGIAVNMKFGKSSLKQQSIDKMIALIKTFMLRGGFELQINVVDHQTLIKAKKHPEAYRDLVVRVGGYSDYFIHLSPAMQEEVIQRSEHLL